MRHHLQRLLKSSLIYGLGTALNQSLSLLILPLFTSYLTPEDYGINSVLSIFNIFLTAIFSLGLGASIGIIYHEHNENNYQGRVIFNSIVTLLPGCLLLFFLGFFASSLSQFLFHTEAHALLVQISIITMIINILNIPLTLMLQFSEKSKSFAFISVFYNLSMLLMSVLLIVHFKLGLMGRVLGYAFGSGINFILLLIFVLKSLSFKYDFKVIQSLLKYGLVTVPSFFSLFILQQGNIYFLNRFSNLSSVGLYSIGSTFGSMLSLFVNSFITAWVPFALTFIQKPDEARKLFGKIMLYYLLLIGCFNLFMFVLAKPLVIVFTNPDYYAAYKVIGLSATVQLLLGIFTILNIENFLAKEIKYSTIAQIVASICFIPLSVTMIIWLNDTGAILAHIMGYMIMIGVIFYFNYKNRHTYLRIQYDITKISFFVILFLISIILFFQTDKFDVWQQLIVNLILFSIDIYIIYALILSNSEKNFLKEKLNQFNPFGSRY